MIHRLASYMVHQIRAGSGKLATDHHIDNCDLCHQIDQSFHHQWSASVRTLHWVPRILPCMPSLGHEFNYNFFQSQFLFYCRITALAASDRARAQEASLS